MLNLIVCRCSTVATFLICIWEVSGLNHDWAMHDLTDFSEFSSVSQDECWDNTQFTLHNHLHTV